VINEEEGEFLRGYDTKNAVLWSVGMGGPLKGIAINEGILYVALLSELKAFKILSPGVIPPTVPPGTTMTKSDLVKALKDLKEAMLKKLDWDIGNTAIAFTDVKDYWRIKRWADTSRFSGFWKTR